MFQLIFWRVKINNMSHSFWKQWQINAGHGLVKTWQDFQQESQVSLVEESICLTCWILNGDMERVSEGSWCNSSSLPRWRKEGRVTVKCAWPTVSHSSAVCGLPVGRSVWARGGWGDSDGHVGIVWIQLHSLSAKASVQSQSLHPQASDKPLRDPQL